ncbi:MAG TPA: M6 family metalloprotease domain-containing protein, partial [Longimicrobiaceae bacterium]|nr:M6 family metalloprotease domain-containing protein [Longimicrobiaceae bacterium]
MSFPFFGKEFTFRQPDGTRLQVRGWGDQHRAVFETLDGYTVMRDPATGFYEYAMVDDDRDELRPTGLRPGMAAPEAMGIEAGARVSHDAARAQAEAGVGLPTPRWQTRREESRAKARFAAEGELPAPPSRQTVGDYVGLCLLVDFPDVRGTITRDEVEAFCNRKGHTGFGNNGSVHDYFLENSAGKLRYTTVVAPYYTAKHPRDYYTNPKVQYPVRARELILEALAHHRAQGFDFSRLTADSQGYVFATNVFYAGDVQNNWSQGLWPHASRLIKPVTLAPGRSAYDYQITDMGQALTLGTYCHENGHMLCDFPDLYDYGDESAGVGGYCLMCAGSNADPRNPTNVGAYLKYRAGWASVTRIQSGLNAVARAGTNQFFIHQKGATEYIIIENRHQSGRDQALTDSGLAIWHVDELGDNSHEQMTPAQHYECSLIQADGLHHLEGGRTLGDSDDLFHKGWKEEWPTAGSQGRWWDGSPTGLRVR